MRVSERGDNPWDEVVLQGEDVIGTERAVVCLCPQMRAGTGVDELHRDAQDRARLAQASFHDIARGRSLANRPHVTSSPASLPLELRAMTRRYEKRERPVTISSDNPSASDVMSALPPLYLNGSTATQKPSSGRVPDVLDPARTGATCGRWSSTRQRDLSRQIATFIGDVTRGLDALTRILLQAAPNQAREVGRQIAAQFGDERRRVTQDRRRQFGRRRTREGTFTAAIW